MTDLWVPAPIPERSPKREHENELIRKATIEFLMWRGWMRLELAHDVPYQSKPYVEGTKRRITQLEEAVEAAIGGELAEYT